MEIEDDIDIEEVEFFFEDSGRAINEEILDSDEIDDECVDSEEIKAVNEGSTKEIKEESEDVMEYDDSNELDVECKFDITKLEEKEEIYVWNSFEGAEEGQTQKRVRNHKKHFCKFCKKLRSDFGSHLKLMHSMEDEVIEYLAETNKNKKRILFNKIAGEGSKLGLSLNLLLSPIKLREDKKSVYGESRCINCQFLVSNLGYVNHLKKCNPQKLDEGRERQTLNIAELRDPSAFKEFEGTTVAIKKKYEDSTNGIKEETQDSKELDIKCEVDITETDQESCHWNSFEGAEEEDQTQENVREIIHVKTCRQKLDEGRERKMLNLAESMRDPSTDALKEEFNDSTNQIKEESVDLLEYEDSKELDLECADDIAEAEKNQEICQWSSSEGTEEEGQTQKKRVRYHKKHFCMFCKKLRTDLSSHLLRMHSMEDKVVEYSTETDKSKKRILFNKIAGEGSKLGLSLKLLLSPIKLREDKKSVHGESRCVSCKLLISNVGYEKHLKKCNPLKLGEGKMEKKRTLAGSMSDAPFASATLKQILVSMNKDEVTAMIKKDKVLCEMTERFLIKHQANAKANKLCARLLRILGRIFLEVQNLLNEDNSETIISGYSFFRPDYYNYFERALKKMAKINSDGIYEKPSVINQYGLLVKATAEFCVGYFTISSDHLKAKNAKKWLTVFGTMFKYVSAGARNQLRQLHKSEITDQKAPNLEESQLTSAVQEKENPMNMDQSESHDEFIENEEKAVVCLPVRKTKISRARIPEKMLRLIRSHFKSFILKKLYPPIDAVKEGQAKLLKLMPDAEVFQRTPEKFRVVINNEINKIKNRQNKEK